MDTIKVKIQDSPGLSEWVLITQVSLREEVKTQTKEKK